MQNKVGKPVYELLSPEGDVYIMQSYVQITDKDLTVDDLASLGSKLSLPDGWTYSTRTLAEDFDLVTTGLAYVINDDLYNSYQRRTLSRLATRYLLYNSMKPPSGGDGP